MVPARDDIFWQSPRAHDALPTHGFITRDGFTYGRDFWHGIGTLGGSYSNAAQVLRFNLWNHRWQVAVEDLNLPTEEVVQCGDHALVRHVGYPSSRHLVEKFGGTMGATASAGGPIVKLAGIRLLI